jgi:hypothetical protein
MSCPVSSSTQLQWADSDNQPLIAGISPLNCSTFEKPGPGGFHIWEFPLYLYNLMALYAGAASGSTKDKSDQKETVAGSAHISDKDIIGVVIGGFVLAVCFVGFLRWRRIWCFKQDEAKLWYTQSNRSLSGGHDIPSDVDAILPETDSRHSKSVVGDLPTHNDRTRSELHRNSSSLVFGGGSDSNLPHSSEANQATT